MTDHDEKHAITVRNLLHLLSMWPATGADGLPSLVLIADRYSGATVPATAAAGLDSDDGGRMHLVIRPYLVGYDPGSVLPDSTPVDLALAALQYRLNTPVEAADPEVEHHLTIRAVDALVELKKAMRLIG